MRKILFVIHDLGSGGAEKVLVNLVNHMDRDQFDITVLSIFDKGVNRQFLADHIHYRSCFPVMPRGNSRMMKLLSPEQLHKWLIRERYDIEVAYLEGPSTRLVSGCPDPTTRLFAWVHGKIGRHSITNSFRGMKEAVECYDRFRSVVCVSEDIRTSFQALIPTSAPVHVLYNTNDSEMILQLAQEPLPDHTISSESLNLIGMGKLAPVKGFDRLLRITRRLKEDGFPVHTTILGDGPQRAELQRYIEDNDLTETVTLAGYQTNPYRYLAACDLFVCSSLSEGFSTAATEALIVGTPVCTVDVPGMKELLGNNEFGIITENSENGLYLGIRSMLQTPSLLAHYRTQAKTRSISFSTKRSVDTIQSFISSF